MGCCGSTDAQGSPEAFADYAHVASLSADRAGIDVRLSGERVLGQGTVLADQAVDQDRSYWEVRIEALPPPVGDVEEDPFAKGVMGKPGQGGLCRIGVCENLQGKDLAGHVPSVDDATSGRGRKGFVVESCVLYAPALQQLKKGDVIGVAVQLSDFPMISFHLNGSHLGGCDVQRFQGTVFPAVSVSSGAVLAVHFPESAWVHRPPTESFQPPLRSQDMI